MNENIDLTKILKDCPRGTIFYSPVYGDVELVEVYKNETFPIKVKRSDNTPTNFTMNGKLYAGYSGECTLFPSKDQRDWSKFTAPWLKKERFDPKTLNPFDKVLVRDRRKYKWACAFFQHITKHDYFKYGCIGGSFEYCIPYNDDTKYLVGTTDEAPEYYRYWED